MCAWIVPPVAGLLEPVPAPEFYVENIGGIELLRGSIRIHLISEQMALEAVAGRPQQIVAVKLIWPLLNVPLIIGSLAQCLFRCPTPESEPPSPARGPFLVR